MKEYHTTGGRLAVPFVHINGTSKASLLEGYTKAYESLLDAEKALCAMAPHMRDYYPYPLKDGQWELADDQHAARLRKISEIMSDLIVLSTAVMEQGK